LDGEQNILESEIKSTDYLCNETTKGKIDSIRMSQICSDRCPASCHQTYYDYKITNKWEVLTSEEPYTGYLTGLSFDIRVKKAPMITSNHYPAINFYTYLANVGGLAGFYLGISCLTIFNYFLEANRYLFTHLKNYFYSKQ
jgi:hypothetical protein